jgi:hypothetical protein
MVGIIRSRKKLEWQFAGRIDEEMSGTMATDEVLHGRLLYT